LNQWQNVGWFELFIQDENQAPKDQILRLNQIVALPVFREAIQNGMNKLKLD